MSKKGPAPTLEIYFNGVFPEDISTRDLAQVVDAVQALSSSAEDERTQVRVVGIRRGSARYLCTTPASTSAVSTLRRVGAQLRDGTFGDEIAEAITSIQDLSAMARRIGCSLVLRDPMDRSDIIATISSDTYDLVSKGLLTRGLVTLAAYVERVGGATAPRCILRLPNQERVVFCSLDSKELARRMGSFVYEDVIASGMATWIRSTHRVVGFKVKEIRQAPRTPLVDSILALRRAGGDAWDRVEDPEKHLGKITGE